MPKTTATLLYRLKQEQQELKNVLGDEYIDFDMVIAHTSGRPVESGQVNELFKQLIEERGYPEVTFHSLRHLSTTVKLLINQGDVKAVQGDTGHAQSKMVTDTYAHILDSSRRTGAEKFDREFFTPSETQTTEAAGNSAELSVEQLLAQCLKNPEAISLLKSIFNTVP